MTTAAQIMDVTRHQLLAGAGFTNDQHAGIAGRDLLHMGQQRL
jgi:hypothetical protein